MRYLAVCLFLFGCGAYDENDFSEADVCFEDGTEGKVSEVQLPPEDADSRLGPADDAPAFDPEEARLPCIVTEWIDLRSGCYYYECENCRPEDAFENPDVIFCGSWLCLPFNSGWINLGYPDPTRK